MSVGFSLSIEPSDAFEALLDVYDVLLDDHGEVVAMEWLNRVVAMSGELFIQCAVDRIDQSVYLCND